MPYLLIASMAFPDLEDGPEMCGEGRVDPGTVEHAAMIGFEPRADVEAQSAIRTILIGNDRPNPFVYCIN